MSVLPPNGLILVTGANGHVASVMIQVFLENGYSVRGTVRSIEKHRALLDYFGPKFSLAEVSDYSTPGAFDEAIKGVDGVAHVAANVTFTLNEAIIEEAVQGIHNVMKAAMTEPRVKRVVYTSAKAACMNEKPGMKYRIDTDLWNDEVFEDLKTPADQQDPQYRGMLVYAAAKYRAEKAGFDFVKEHKPHFTYNSVLPNVNMGRTVAIGQLGFPGGSSLISALDRGFPLGPVAIPNQWFVNTEDTALLHLAALTQEDVQNERILSMSGPYSWKQIIEILNCRYPERPNMLKQFDDLPVDIGAVDNARGAELLRRMGRDGFRNLEESLVEAMECIIAADSLPSIPRTFADDMIDMLFKAKSST